MWIVLLVVKDLAHDNHIDLALQLLVLYQVKPSSCQESVPFASLSPFDIHLNHRLGRFVKHLSVKVLKDDLGCPNFQRHDARQALATA